METLNDALDRDTKMIGALQDQVVQEFKQADSAGRIIEAYANTSHANFLYAGNNSAGQYVICCSVKWAHARKQPCLVFYYRH